MYRPRSELKVRNLYLGNMSSFPLSPMAETANSPQVSILIFLGVIGVLEGKRCLARNATCQLHLQMGVAM